MKQAPRPFYRIADQLPPLGVPVLVIWDGRGPFEAARVAHPKTRRESWAAKHGGETVLLPTTERGRDVLRPWAGWHTLKNQRPDYWSPKDVARWGLTLPEVAFVFVDTERPSASQQRKLSCVGPSFENTRFWTATQSFDAVAAAEEMESERLFARRSAPGGRLDEGESPGAKLRRLWWLDATQVGHAAPGAISKREAEGRLMRHLAAQSLVLALTGAGLDRRDLDRDALQALAEAEADALPAYVPRFDPLPADAADDDTVSTWFSALSFDRAGRRVTTGFYDYTQTQRCLAHAANVNGLSFSEIAAVLGVKKQRAFELYKDGVERVWAIANNFADAGVTARAAALERVRHANRQARRDRARAHD